MKQILIDLSYNAAMQKAYRGQIDRPQMVYRNENGLFFSMPLCMWKMIRTGVPCFIVEHLEKASGMRVKGVDGEWDG
jgi:hypothetical protein